MLRDTSTAAATTIPADADVRGEMPQSGGGTGLVFAFIAFGSWGLMPLYFAQIAHVDPVRVLAQRAVWSLPLVLAMVLIGGRGRRLVRLVKTQGLWLLPTTVLLAGNWLGFVWLMVTGRFVESSIAYYIAPMLMAALGVFVLGERLRLMQLISLAVATAGVLVLIYGAGVVPWVSIGMALSWSLYSLVRRAKKIPSLEGLTVELSFFILPALVWLTMYGYASRGEQASPADLWWLAGLGAITVMPLLFFGAAATRINLATLGVLQFIAPTAQFLLGVFFNGEPFDLWRGIAFVFIWTAVSIYAFDGIRQGKRSRSARAT